MGPLTSRAINNNNAPLRRFPIMPPMYYLEGGYGTIGMRGITFTQLGGWMEIAPH